MLKVLKTSSFFKAVSDILLLEILKELYMYKKVLLALPALFALFFGAGCFSSPQFAEIDLNGKHLVIDVGGAKYIADADIKKSGWLNIENCGGPAAENTINTNLTDSSYKQWTHFNSDKIEDIKIVKDSPDEKIIYLKIKCSDWYKESKNYDVYYLEINLITRKDIPCLLVYQRVCNLTEQPQKINFGSYTSGITKWGADLNISEVDPANKAWLKIVKGNCIWLEKGGNDEKKKGLGIIEFGKSGFALFLGHRVFWGYGNSQMIPPGKYLENKTALILAGNPAEFMEVYEKIKDVKFGDFITDSKRNSDENTKGEK